MPDIKNGNGVGFRNLPTPFKATGVWGADEAYLAARDDVWPRWPANIGIPYDSRLQMWFESDYGLYQDTDLTVPAIADTNVVRGWVNRGVGGRMTMSGVVPPTRVGGAAPAVQWAGGALGTAGAEQADTFFINRRQNNYVFMIENYVGNNQNRAIITGPESTGSGTAMRAAPAASHLSNSQMYTGASNSASLLTSAAAAFGLRSQLLPYVNPSSGLVTSAATAGSGINAYTLATSFVTPGAAQITVMKTFGATGTLVAGAQIKALLWYTSDTQMTVAELNQVYQYLGTKYATAYPTILPYNP